MRLYLLAIPAVIGLAAGFYLTSDVSRPYSLGAELSEGGSPILGDSDAPITILEWGDYQCTYCFKFHQGTRNIIQQDFIDTGRVKMVFKDFALNGPDSVLAAEASYCAGDQQKYWQYHDELYKNWAGENTGWVNRDSLAGFADTIELNPDEFIECLDEHKYQDKVRMLYESGQEIGIDATPSFIIFNDKDFVKIRGNQPLEVFLRAFDEL